MSGRYADQVHAPVQTAIERKVRCLRIHAALVFIAAGNHQQVLPLLRAQIRHIRPKQRIAALVIGHFRTVHIHSGLLSCRRELHIHSSPCQRLPRRPEALGIPVSAAVEAAVPVMAVHRVPGMRQIYFLPVLRQGLGKPRIFLDESPVLIQMNQIPHSCPP